MQKEKEQFWREHEERAGERKKQKQKDEEEIFAKESDKEEQIRLSRSQMSRRADQIEQKEKK